MKTPEKNPKPSGKDGNQVNPFRTCDENGKPVMFRFSSAKSLRDVYTKAQQDDLKDSERRAKILGMYEGRLPWDPRKLEAAGFKDKANFNTLELRGQIEARAGAVSNLALDTTDLVELRPLSAELSGPDADKIGKIVADEFSATLRDGLEFLPALATAVRECDLYGFGPLMWPDPVDYKPTAVLRGQVKLHEQAPHLSSKNELIMVEGTLPASYVFGLFDNPSASKEMGWSLEPLKRYAVQTFVEGKDSTSQTGDNYGTSVLESAVMEARENRLFETKQFEIMRVIHAFVREVSGDRRVSHYMISAEPSIDEFLLVRYGVYESMNECFVWLPYAVTETRAAALRGIASYLAPVAELKNKKMCELMDSADQLSRTYLTRSQGSNERLTVLEQGRYTVLPPEVTPQPPPLNAANVQQAASIVDLVSRVTVNNALGAFGTAATSSRVYKGADRKTKEEVLIEKEEGEKSEQAQFVARSVVFDLVFRECFRRFMKIVLDGSLRPSYPEAAAFLKRCEARGIGKDVLKQVPDVFNVYLCRDVVTGGAQAKAGLLSEVIGLGGSLDEVGRIDATHEYIRCRMGSLAADRYRPIVGRDTQPSDAASHALLENNDMLELAAVLAAPDQLHWSHIPIHGRLVQQITQAVQNGQVEDPQRMLDTLQLVSEHIQEHIRYGGAQIGKADDAKAAMADLRSLRPIQQALTIMASNVDRVRRAEEEKQQREMEALQQRADGQETAVKMKEIDTKAALKLREQDLMHQARMTQADSKAQTDMFRAKMKAEIDRIAATNRRFLEAAKITGNPPPSSEGLVPPDIM